MTSAEAMSHQGSERSPRTGREVAAALLLYCGLTGLFFMPSGDRLASRITPDVGDPVLNLVFLKWGEHRLRAGLDGYWSPPFFHPTPGALAFSDHLIGLVPQFAALRGLTGNELAAYNLLVLASFALTGVTTFLVIRAGGAGGLGAAFGGLLFAFSHFRWAELSHLQVLTVQWLPPLLWFWHRLLAAPRWRHAGLFALFYVLHVSGGSYLAYMAHIPLLALLVLHARARGRRLFAAGGWRPLGTAVVLAAAVAFAAFWPYVSWGTRLGITYPRAEIRTHGATARSLVAVGDASAVRPFWPVVASSALFPGLLATAFAVGGWRHWRRNAGGEVDPYRRGVLLGGAAGLLLVLPTVFVPLSAVVPGLGGMRATGRFIVLAHLAIAHLAAAGLDALLRRRRAPLRPALGALVLAAAALESAPATIAWRPLPREAEFPAVHRWIRAHPEVEAYLELPIRRDPREILRMYWATLHWRPLANGHSGQIAKSFLQLEEACAGEPGGSCLETARRLDISHLVLEVPRRGQRVRAAHRARRGILFLAEAHPGELRRVYSDRRNEVWRIGTSSAPAASRPRAALPAARSPARAGSRSAARPPGTPRSSAPGRPRRGPRRG